MLEPNSLSQIFSPAENQAREFHSPESERQHHSRRRRHSRCTHPTRGWSSLVKRNPDRRQQVICGAFWLYTSPKVAPTTQSSDLISLRNFCTSYHLLKHEELLIRCVLPVCVIILWTCSRNNYPFLFFIFSKYLITFNVLSMLYCMKNVRLNYLYNIDWLISRESLYWWTYLDECLLPWIGKRGWRLILLTSRLPAVPESLSVGGFLCSTRGKT